jgi:hypothetical protein
MPITYSINDAPTKSESLGGIGPVLNALPDNFGQEIKANDVRNSFLTLWANSPFKLTGNTPNDYIGIDTGNPLNRDIKKKILLGKRSSAGLDIMTPGLIASNTDIFFYNTKLDTDPDQSTKISILAGTNSSLHENSPSIRVTPTQSSLDMFIENPSGDISITSVNSRVSINGLNFPTVAENLAAFDGYVFRYNGVPPLGRAEWVNPLEFSPALNYIGNTGSETNIYGSPVYVNGYPIEFVDPRDVPKTIGGVEIGFSFPENSFEGINGNQDWPITEVIRKLLYPYVEPELELSIINSETLLPYGDIGNTNNVTINYSVTIFPRDASEWLDSIDLREDGTVIDSIGSLTGTPGTGTSSTLFRTVGPTYPFSTYVDYELEAKNSLGTFSLIEKFNLVRPFLTFLISDVSSPQFISNSDVVSGSGNATASLYYFLVDDPGDSRQKRTILPYSDVVKLGDVPPQISPNDFLYFAYPWEYPELSGIRYNNSFTGIQGSFTYSESPSPIPGVYGQYRIYKSLNTVGLSPDDNFTLLFSKVPFSFCDPILIDTWTFSSVSSIPIGTPPIGYIQGVQRRSPLQDMPSPFTYNLLPTPSSLNVPVDTIYINYTSNNNINYSPGSSITDIGDLTIGSIISITKLDPSGNPIGKVVYSLISGITSANNRAEINAFILPPSNTLGIPGIIAPNTLSDGDQILFEIIKI